MCKKLDKIYSVSDVPVEQHPMKLLLLQTFDKLSHSKIYLKSTKQKALVDFLSPLPEVATRSCTKKNVQYGFIENGMIDKKDKT